MSFRIMRFNRTKSELKMALSFPAQCKGSFQAIEAVQLQTLVFWVVALYRWMFVAQILESVQWPNLRV